MVVDSTRLVVFTTVSFRRWAESIYHGMIKSMGAHVEQAQPVHYGHDSVAQEHHASVNMQEYCRVNRADTSKYWLENVR